MKIKASRNHFDNIFWHFRSLPTWRCSSWDGHQRNLFPYFQQWPRFNAIHSSLISINIQNNTSTNKISQAVSHLSTPLTLGRFTSVFEWELKYSTKHEKEKTMSTSISIEIRDAFSIKNIILKMKISRNHNHFFRPIFCAPSLEGRSNAPEVKQTLE